MADPVFGIGITRIDNEPRPAVVADMSVVGLVGTAPLADAAQFPLNTPVRIFSDDADALTALGTTGTLPDAVTGINDQLGEFQVAAQIVVVRVTEGADDDATIANIIGSQAAETGIHALLNAGADLGVVPRLIGCPGYTQQHVKDGVTAVTVDAGGTGYADSFPVTGTGDGTGFAGTATAAGGVVESVTVDDPGSGYTTLTLDFSAGGGTGADGTASFGNIANAVCAALPAVLSQLLGVAVVDGPATSLEDFIDWRETLSSERLIAVETAVLVGEPTATVPASPRVLGIAVRRDHEKGGRPFHSWANQPVHGIVAPNRTIRFSLTDAATEGQQILASQGGVILRGEAGVETGIAGSGFIFVGTDTLTDDPLWQFYNVVRGRDFIHLMFLRTLRFYLGRFNITGQTVQAVVNTMNFALRDLKADDDILGYQVGFTRDQNTPEQLRQGRFTVNFAAEEPPVLRFLGIRSARYRPALDALLDDLLAQTDAIAG